MIPWTILCFNNLILRGYGDAGMMMKLLLLVALPAPVALVALAHDVYSVQGNDCFVDDNADDTENRIITLIYMCQILTLIYVSK